MQTGLVIWTTESQRRAFKSSSTDEAKHSTGVSRSRPWFFFFIGSRLSGHGSSIASETTSGGVRHSTEKSNSNWIEQPELYHLVPKPVMHKMNKHIETKFPFIRDKSKDGTRLLQFIAFLVPCDQMVDYIFTKSLPVSKLETFRTFLMETDSTLSAEV